MRAPRFPLLSVALLAAAAACGGESAGSAGSSDASLRPDTTVGTTIGASPTSTAGADSVIAWAREIREGVAPLAGRVATDPEGARQRAVELYITRQERIEQTLGPGSGSSADLAESVLGAEARFHDLMQLLGETPPPDSTRVAEAVAALDAGLGEVLARIDAEEPEAP
jgi:hypothetical protein